MTTEIDLAHHIHSLKLLLKTAEDPKLLWEEMQILGKKAFHLQEKMEKELEELEKATKEVTSIQMIYETRENMWDIMNKIATRELELKNKPHPAKAPEHHCCCHHHAEDHCCCHHESEPKKCCHQKATKKKCCCKGKKTCPKK